MKKQFRRIMGRNCISEVLKAAPERIVEVYTAQEPDDSLFAALLEKNIPVREVPKHELSRLVNTDSHQSYVAAIKEILQPTLKEFLSKSREQEKSLVLILDSIFDPQNLGAIIRAAHCFGAELVVFSKNRGGDITPVVTKASDGATELIPILKVSNLVETLRSFQKENYWGVAAEASEKAESLYDFEFPNKTV